MFYHDVKEHMSPSAFQTWKHQRSSFVKSYFQGEKTPETAAMKAGTQSHRLIEAGLLPVKHYYEHNELELRHPAGEFKTMGKPDSFELQDDAAYFVDYKTGKANGWAEKLPSDVKMIFTAWLVWNETGKPEKVVGHIEFLPTTWDPTNKEVILIDGAESEVETIVYHREQLENFTDVIIREMQAVNTFYEKWSQQDTSFIDQEDCQEAARLTAEIEALSDKLTKVKDRIKDQMEFGGVNSYPVEGLGTFSITERKTYNYPTGLRINYRDYGLTFEDFQEAEKCAKAAKKNFELISEPVAIAESIRFVPPRKKK